ncbi:MAG: ABC transporter ATP-binding protein/permease [Defluviitaleaceae bacterium]|nr:ABC transporter ATP-binding protein/permease [Defluviitaleaceae bacterium]
MTTSETVRKEMLKPLKRRAFVVLLFIAAVAAAFFILAPVALNAIIQDTMEITFADILLVISLLLVGYTLQFLNVLISNALMQKYYERTSQVLFRNVFKLGYDKYLEIGPTAVRDLAYDAIEAYCQFYLFKLPSFVVNVMLIIATSVIAFFVSPIVAVVMITIILVNIFGFALLNKVLAKMSIKLRDTNSVVLRDINAITTQVDFIKQNPGNAHLLPMIAAHTSKLMGVRKRVNSVANGVSGLLAGALQVLQAVIIVYLSMLALNDPALLGSVVYVFLVFPYFFMALGQIVGTNLSVAAIRAANDFIDNLVKNAEHDGDVPISKVEKIDFNIDKIEMKDNVILSNVKLQFSQGDIVGIMGESGSGKSTLAKLLIKFRSTDEISVNGVPISKITNDSYLKLMSYYSQSTPIITDTIYNNLNFGRDPIEKSVYQNLSFLKRFKNLDDNILENGANLSAGERQRIALARIFTEEAQVVILDEPTSSLDEDAENEILAEIFEGCKDKIFFLISHSSDNMKYCTHVYKIENGNLVGGSVR